MKPSCLMPLLSVPGTDSPVKFVISSYGANNEPYSGWVEDENENVVGRLENFKFSFVNFLQVTAEEKNALHKFGARKALIYDHELLALDDDRIRYEGDWFYLGDYLKGCSGNHTDASFTVRTSAPLVKIKLHSHGWSGIAEISVNSDHFDTVDLFNRETSIPKVIQISNEAMVELEIRISSTGLKNTHSLGRQVILEAIYFFNAEKKIAAYPAPINLNRGGAFRPRFFEILQSLPSKADATILDIGGGKRKLNLPGYINLEYSPYDEPVLFGDALALPFKSDTIDFIYTAAVIEHVINPIKMGDEAYRVLKPGGKLLANSAFMQPIHSEGQHFFNCTPYALEIIFGRFEKIHTSWEGSISDTFNWMLKVAGVYGCMDRNEAEFLSRLLSKFDQKLTYEKLMYVASGVWAEATK